MLDMSNVVEQMVQMRKDDTDVESFLELINKDLTAI